MALLSLQIKTAFAACQVEGLGVGVLVDLISDDELYFDTLKR